MSSRGLWEFAKEKRRASKTNSKDEKAQRFVRFSIDPNADEQELQRAD